MLNFLAKLYEEGYQYRSLNSYRSAISSVHERVDGRTVGEHPLVMRLMKGVFIDRPPLLRYTSTWNVQTVLSHIASFGVNDHQLEDSYVVGIDTPLQISLSFTAGY